MPPRYAKQPDSYSCGPIAILNALKWAGNKVTIRDHLKSLKVLCKCEIDGEKFGTAHKDFDKAIRKAGRRSLYVLRKTNVKLKDMIDHIDDGGAVALLYSYKKNGERCGHYILFVGHGKNVFYVVNDCPTYKTLHRRRYRKMKEAVRKTAKTPSFPRAWFLTKEDD